MADRDHLGGAADAAPVHKRASAADLDANARQVFDERAHIAHLASMARTALDDPAAIGLDDADAEQQRAYAIERLDEIINAAEPEPEPDEQPSANAVRAARGRAAVELHPDLREGGIDFETAAADVIADILHAHSAETKGGTATATDLIATDLIERAERTFFGDVEDD